MRATFGVGSETLQRRLGKYAVRLLRTAMAAERAVLVGIAIFNMTIF
jgi:hypothetical protein